MKLDEIVPWGSRHSSMQSANPRQFVFGDRHLRASSSIFTQAAEISSSIAKILHIDGTSLSVHGKYSQLEEEKIEQNLSAEVQSAGHSPEEDDQTSEENLEPVPINVIKQDVLY
jgi:hypothetical protein